MPNSVVLLEIVLAVVVAAVLAYAIQRLTRPKTTREILERPPSFFVRIQSTVDAYGQSDDDEFREELHREALASFEDALREHGLAMGDFELSIEHDDIERLVAKIRRRSDGRTWSLQEFDDFLLMGRAG